VSISSYASFASFINTRAPYHIGSNTINLEGMTSFAEAKLSPSFDQGKHQAHPLELSLSAPLLFVLDCVLKCRSLMKP
jgi:hypothetical protein